MVSPPLQNWLAAALVFVAVTMGAVAVALVWEWLRERRQRRGVGEQLRRLNGELGSDGAGSASVFRSTTPDAPAWLLAVSSRLPHLRDLELRLEQAALSWSVQTYLLLSVSASLALGLTIYLLLGSGLLAAPAAGVGALLPNFWLRRQCAQRLAAFEEQFPESVDLLGRAIRAGHPISAGFKMVADEAPEPVAGEFRRVFEEQRFGLPFNESLLAMADRVPLVDVRIFATAVLIQRDVGGNLAEVLDKLSHVVRQRFSILRQIRTFTAQGRMSGYILGSLPIFLAIVLFFINPENMRNFVQAPLGKVLITLAVVLQTFGALWIRKIIRIEI